MAKKGRGKDTLAGKKGNKKVLVHESKKADLPVRTVIKYGAHCFGRVTKI